MLDANLEKSETTLGNDGFSLVELLIVITIVIILSSVAWYQYSQWITKSAVEDQIKKMATDISELRLRALTTKQRHSVIFYENSYVFKSYSTETFTTDPQLVANGTVLPGNRTVKFRLASNSAGTTFFTGKPLEINQQGLLAGLSDTIYLEARASESSASVNCLSINTVRINVGRLNTVSGACDDR